MASARGFSVLSIASAVLVHACSLSTEGTAPAQDAVASGAGASGATTTSSAASGGSGTGGGTGARGGAGPGGAGGEAGAGGQGGGGIEDCSNGADDDADGAVDCEDVDDCTDHACVPAAPNAIAYVWSVSSDNHCGARNPAQTLHGCDADCGCDDVGGTCSASVSGYSNATCTQFLAVAPNSGCWNTGDGNKWFSPDVSHDGNASCDPIDARVATTEHIVCQASNAGTCAGGLACVPKTSSPTPIACVVVDGAAPCPGSYPVRVEVAPESANATCDCSCSVAQASCGAVSMTVYDNSDSCNGGSSNISVSDGGCASAGYVESFSFSDPAGMVTCNASTTLVSASTLALCCAS